MKLRTQFVMLVAGIIAMPFLVSAFVLLLHYSVSSGREPLPNYARISTWVRSRVPRAVRTARGSYRMSASLVVVLPPRLCSKSHFHSSGSA